MGNGMKKGVATVAQLTEFDEIIDVRSPAEFAEDRIPGALSCPVLSNEQRAEVGTIYTQVGAFEARRLGGAMVAANLARHLFAHFQDRPKNWRPLVYCWRGGMRSGVFVNWLRLIGWDAHQLEGGYKNYRREVIASIAALAPQLSLRIVCGPTGSGKTRLLEALAEAGAQVLDLEGLAAHKGSVLGNLPGRPQPGQKWFETLLLQTLQGLDPQRPIYVEAESRKIGRIEVPVPLIEHMRASPCVAIDATDEARREFLLRDYAYLGDDRPGLQEKLTALAPLHGKETIARWLEWAERGALAELFGELMRLHYDPLYKRSQNNNYQRFGDAPRFSSADLRPEGLRTLAREILGAQA